MASNQKNVINNLNKLLSEFQKHIQQYEKVGKTISKPMSFFGGDGSTPTGIEKMNDIIKWHNEAPTDPVFSIKEICATAHHQLENYKEPNGEYRNPKRRKDDLYDMYLNLNTVHSRIENKEIKTANELETAFDNLFSKKYNIKPAK